MSSNVNVNRCVLSQRMQGLFLKYQTLSLEDVQAWMAECKVAKQYWPERLEIVRDFPLSTFGKVAKDKLAGQVSGK